MTEEEMVSLATSVAGRFVGLIEEEWVKWSEYVRTHGLRKALRFARIAASSPSLHPGIRQSYRTISDVIPKFLRTIESLSVEERDRFLGYVRRALVARRLSFMGGARGVRCGVCGFQIESDEEARVHDHIPDFFLTVWNCRAVLARSRGTHTEELPFEIPDHWVEFILEASGGSLNMSGIYRLPGLFWEWVLLKCRGDEDGARFVADRIERFLERCGWTMA